MAKGKSPVAAKWDAYRSRMYTDAQRMNYEACDCDGGARPSQATIDRAADLALSGGYKLRVPNGRRGGAGNVCPTCFCARSVNGSCGC
jgi:hypothetical protein